MEKKVKQYFLEEIIQIIQITQIIQIKRLKQFATMFLFLFILSPSIYFYHSNLKKNERTDYRGKEIAKVVQNKWDNTFLNEIQIVFGDIWYGGNLSYHLKSNPKWTGGLWLGIKEVPKNINGGVIVIGDYVGDISKHVVCIPTDNSPHIVILELESFEHSVCMIGKK